jgi:hypothetical protein
MKNFLLRFLIRVDTKVLVVCDSFTPTVAYFSFFSGAYEILSESAFNPETVMNCNIFCASRISTVNYGKSEQD